MLKKYVVITYHIVFENNAYDFLLYVLHNVDDLQEIRKSIYI